MDQIQLDWDLKNLETKSTHQVCSAYYPAKRGHSQQGIPFPWTGSSIQKLYGCFPGFFIHPPSHPHDVKEHMIHHTRPTSVVQFWCSDSYCWRFWQWTGVSMGTLTAALYTAFAPHVHQWALTTHDPYAGSPLFLTWSTFNRNWQMQTRNAPLELQFWRWSDLVI